MVRILLVAAGALTVLRIAVPFVPVYGVSLATAHAVCSSWLGALAQAYDSGSAANCAKVALAYDGLNVVTAAAVACTAGAVLLMARAARAGR